MSGTCAKGDRGGQKGTDEKAEGESICIAGAAFLVTATFLLASWSSNRGQHGSPRRKKKKERKRKKKEKEKRRSKHHKKNTKGKKTGTT